MLKTLANLGFGKRDTDVYVFLSEMGPQKGKIIADVLHLSRQQLYRSLKYLRKRHVVNISVDHPVLFSAIPFEQLIELVIGIKLEQARVLKESREELLSSWRSMGKQASSDSQGNRKLGVADDLFSTRIRSLHKS